jgi:hypothetical protein
MKQLIAALLIVASSVAFAQHRNPYGYATGTYPQRHHHYHHHHHHRDHDLRWLAPAIIGGVVAYAITRPPVVVQQPPVIMQPSVIMQPPVIMQPANDVVYIDGVPYRKQLVLIDGHYQEVLVRM